MEQALLRLITLAEGGTQQWGPDVGMRKGKHGESRMLLASEDTWTVDQLAWDFSYGATTHRARLRIIREAQQMADRIRYAPRPKGPMRNSVEWKRMIATDKRSCRDLEEEYGVSKSTIARIKQEYRSAA